MWAAIQPWLNGIAFSMTPRIRLTWFCQLLLGATQFACSTGFLTYIFACAG